MSNTPKKSQPQKSGKLSDVSLLISTFERPHCLERLIASIRRFYPEITILVADDSQDAQTKQVDNNCQIYKMENDVGLSAKRNFLISICETKYFVILDDDFIFTEATNIEEFRKEIAKAPFPHIVAGAVTVDGELKHYEGHYELNGEHLLYKKGKNEAGQYEFVFNFFIARTKDFQEKFKWDNYLKLAEHTAFFFKYRGKLKIEYLPFVQVENAKDNNPEYAKWRKRGHQFFRQFMEQNGLTSVTDWQGKEYAIGTRTALREFGERYTIGITTFMRKASLERLVMSIAKHHPQSRIIIADCSNDFDTEFYQELWAKAKFDIKPTAYRLPFDCGLSKMRNFISTVAPTQYILYLEDDFEWTEKTNPDAMLKLMGDRNVGIVGGQVEETSGMLDFHGALQRTHDKVELYKDPNGVDFVLNFIMARKRALLSIGGWDEQFKIYEHTDFFLRFKKTQWKVLYTDESTIFHHRERTEDYKPFRERKDFLVQFFRKHGLRYLVQFGKVIELNEKTNKTKTYYATDRKLRRNS